MPKFSVTIAVYNKEKHIAQTLAAVLAQTFIDFEVIIVNDGSTDKSEAIIKSFDDARIHYFTQKNQGAAAGRNAAINKASAPYIALLDADDLWEPTYLEAIHNTIEENSEEMVFSTAVAIETRGNTIKSKYSIENLKPGKASRVDYFETSSLNTVLTGSSTVLHKSVLDNVGLFDTSIKSGQDTDLWIRIGLKYKIIFINTYLVSYRFVQQSLSNKTRDIASKPTFDTFTSYEKKIPEDYRPIQKAYQSLKKNGALKLFIKIMKSFEKAILKNLTSNNPSLFLFDLYRLNYYVNLQSKS